MTVEERVALLKLAIQDTMDIVADFTTYQGDKSTESLRPIAFEHILPIMIEARVAEWIAEHP